MLTSAAHVAIWTSPLLLTQHQGNEQPRPECCWGELHLQVCTAAASTCLQYTGYSLSFVDYFVIFTCVNTIRFFVAQFVAKFLAAPLWTTKPI